MRSGLGIFKFGIGFIVMRDCFLSNIGTFG